MNRDELEQMIEELNAKTEIGLGEDALAVCRQILDEADEMDAAIFRNVCNTIGMFASNVSDWIDDLVARFETLNYDERLEVTDTWVLLLCESGALWEDIKPHISLRQLSGGSQLYVCRYAISAQDMAWCQEALRLLDAASSQHYASCGMRLARAALLDAFGNHLSSLEALQGFKIETVFFEDYFEILTKALVGHYKESLEKIERDMSLAQLWLDPKIELKLPDNDRLRFEEVQQWICKARSIIIKLAQYAT